MVNAPTAAESAASAGLRSSAFFFGHATLHLIDILVQPAVFLSMYYTLVLPEIRFVDYYIGELRMHACTCFLCWAII